MKAYYILKEGREYKSEKKSNIQTNSCKINEISAQIRFVFHTMVTTSSKISCRSVHWATTTNKPQSVWKKTRWLLSITCTGGTVSTSPPYRWQQLAPPPQPSAPIVILPFPPIWPFDHTTATNTTELAASAYTVNRTVSSNTTDRTATA